MNQLETIRLAKAHIREVACKQGAQKKGDHCVGFYFYDMLVLLQDGNVWQTGFYARKVPSLAFVAALLVRHPGQWSLYSKMTP